MAIFKLPYCPECGESRVPHHLEKLPQFFDGFVGVHMDGIEKFAERMLGMVFTPDVGFYAAKAAAAIGLIRIETRPTKNTSTRTLALYEGADATGVTLYSLVLFGAPFGYIAEKDGVRVGFNVIPRPRGFVSPSLDWMDDKGILKEKLKAAGLPCADGGIAKNEADALALFRKIGRPVIAKPHRGSRGRHTTLDIRTEEDLKRGFKIAAQLSRKVVIEAYLHGTVHRVTLVGGEPVAIARREYPHVVGDGVHTVSELIDIENQNPMRDGLFYRKLDKVHRVKESLDKQNLTIDSVPEKGKTVILSDKNSRLHGTVTEDITAKVHPENIKLFRRLGVVLADPIAGVDFMIDDMTRPWTEQPDSGFLECNSMPFVDVHHKVVSGETINVAKYLWEEIFKKPALA